MQAERVDKCRYVTVYTNPKTVIKFNIIITIIAVNASDAVQIFLNWGEVSAMMASP